ncbi:RNA polymerase III subunit G [Tachypleus tridentatus]|uniref:RNA polymerase III subunit G n=1 Tax=Tachypleus tridentatus TaxID=6853 RepID=UPI003FD1211B
MAGRGRGRGRGMNINVEALGFGRGEALPAPTLEPPPLFPNLEFKPRPLLSGEEHDYILALKQELRGTLKDSGFYVHPVVQKKDVERYTDKYQHGTLSGSEIKFDWKRFPDELKLKAPKRKLSQVGNKPSCKKQRGNVDVNSRLEELESLEQTKESDEEEEKKEEAEEEGEVEGDEVIDEEDLEEETDYAMNYFDNGDAYLDEEDDNLDDGPTY